MTDIILLEDSLCAVRMLSDSEAGALLKALIDHTEGIEPQGLPERAALVYPLVRGQADRMLSMRDRNRANGAHGGRPKKTDGFSNEKPTGLTDGLQKSKPPVPVPIPVNKEKEIIKKEKVDLPDTGIWGDTQVREAFADYAKMRIRIKKSMTQEAVKRKIPQLERLASTPADAVEIIHRATDNCWLDFYADRQTAKPKEPGYIKRGTDYDSFLNQIGV